MILLTLAGRDLRFRNEGFKTPKYLLPWGDKTVLAAILTEFLKGGAFSDAFLIANHVDEAYMPHVRAILRAHGVDPSRVSLTHDTSGQAETAQVGLDAIEAARRGTSDESIVVSNSDTILYGRNYAKVAATLRQADGFIDVFKSNDRSYSYVLLDDQDRVQEIAEKMVVSNVATSGCYGFRSAAVYRTHYADGDVYVSGVFKKMLADGCRVVAERHTEDDTVVLGSPDEYMNASAVRL